MENRAWSPATPLAQADDPLSSAETEDEERIRERQHLKGETPPSEDRLGVRDGPSTPELDSKKSLASTPPKKILRVRSDGKLSSPKNSDMSNEIRPRRRGRPKQQIEKPSNGIVIIKYGRRKKARIFVGQKINAILSAPLVIAKDVAASKLVEKSSPDQKKPTHPFFTSGISRALGKSTPDSTEGTKELDQEQDTSAPKLLSPRKARVNSKPPGIPTNIYSNVAFGLPTFGSDHARITRFPGAKESLWPPSGMVHVGISSKASPDLISTQDEAKIPPRRRKLKQTQINIQTDEEVLRPAMDILRSTRVTEDTQTHAEIPRVRQFQRPRRHVMPGVELQEIIHQRIHHKLALRELDRIQDLDELGVLNLQPDAPPALHRVFKGIATSRSAFDRFEWESYDWAHKYAPKTAEDVLQQGKEALMIRDWLRSLTVTSVGTQNLPALSNRNLKPGKRKKRRVKERDEFIVSSDEEVAEMTELSDPEGFESSRPGSLKRTVFRTWDKVNSGPGQRASHAIVLSGPNGCGKSATVYAVAQELGFEVFEINSGSRRSGKDILDKVGDMAHNHLVGKESNGEAKDAESHTEDIQRLSEKLQQDLDSGRQGTMQSFFQSKGPGKEKLSSRKIKENDDCLKSNPIQKERKSQKQSLILLEEVDILFEEDKLFWITVLDLIANTRRPLIMTCTDETLLPLDEMMVFGIFRFYPCSEQLATDYLLLLACNEGHLLERDAVSALYKAKRYDLRASIFELQFFCQMAIGDRKGGLEWMLLNAKPRDDIFIEQQAPLRVVSENTYYKGCGWLGGEKRPMSHLPTIIEEVDISLYTCNMWDIDLADEETQLAASGPKIRAARGHILSQLQELDQLFEAYSLTDMLPIGELRETSMVPLDITQPECSEKLRNQFVEGVPLIQADIMEDAEGFGLELAITLRAIAARTANTYQGHGASDISERTIAAIITKSSQRSPQDVLSYQSMSFAFDPISRSQKPALGIAKGDSISSFESPTSVIVEDVAPYIRSIVSYDLRLEEQRQQLEAATLKPGKDGGQTRKTRASRAALEGGSKANTRRERWFPNSTNYDLVLETGGQQWQEVALSMMNMERSESVGSGDMTARSTPASSMADELQ